MPLRPVGLDEAMRASRRSGVQLQAGRVILPQTRTRREKLLADFDVWLAENIRVTLDRLLDIRSIDAEIISDALVSYEGPCFQ